MTEKQHLSGNIICNTFNDMDVLFIEEIGGIQICSTISRSNALIYTLASNDAGAIEQFNVAWNDYKGAI